MASLANWRSAALLGVGIFLLHVVIYRSWPPQVADLVGSALLGLGVAVGVFLIARLLGRKA